MANAVVQAEVGKEGKGPAGMTCLVYTRLPWQCILHLHWSASLLLRILSATAMRYGTAAWRGREEWIEERCSIRFAHP